MAMAPTMLDRESEEICVYNVPEARFFKLDAARDRGHFEDLGPLQRNVALALLWLIWLVARDVLSKMPTFRVVASTNVIRIRHARRPIGYRLRESMISQMEADNQAYAVRIANLKLPHELDESGEPVDDTPDFPELDRAREELSRLRV
jgi:hypothetical protein